VWLPVAPAILVAAWLCGWALVEPDPIPEGAPVLLILMSVPLAMVFARALIRVGWSLFGDRRDPGTATVGLLRPWILFSPHLAKTLDDRQIEAALAHERAHARHRDPLRILLAQLATDLQWPWPQAGVRMRRWLFALELARDEEACAAGIEGADLAEAILATARCNRHLNLSAATLTGEVSALKERIDRLLAPPSQTMGALPNTSSALPTGVVSLLVTALTLGAIFGEQVVRALFRIAA
jgi:beta-lactamase regulating signal transducer with metallopeptidase domain